MERDVRPVPGDFPAGVVPVQAEDTAAFVAIAPDRTGECQYERPPLGRDALVLHEAFGVQLPGAVADLAGAFHEIVPGDADVHLLEYADRMEMHLGASEADIAGELPALFALVEVEGGSRPQHCMRQARERSMHGDSPFGTVFRIGEELPPSMAEKKRGVNSRRFSSGLAFRWILSIWSGMGQSDGEERFIRYIVI